MSAVPDFPDTEWLEDALKSPEPGGVELAIALSVATRIEPELVRAVRLAALPHLDVGAESDFWFGDWIGARQPHVVALQTDGHVLPWLRWQLAGWFDTSGANHPIRRLRKAIEKVHKRLSPALALEEEITWCAVTGEDGGLDRARELLRRPTRAMVEERRRGIADWVAGAIHRLPHEVAHSVDGWHLALVARWARPADVHTEPELAELGERGLVHKVYGPVDMAIQRMAEPNDALTTIVNVRWDGDCLVVDTQDPRDGASTMLPNTVPLAIEVIEHGQLTGTWLTLPVRHESSGNAVRLRTIDGRVLDVPKAIGNTVQAAPILVRIPGAGGYAIQFWLQPVSFSGDRTQRGDQPSRLLALALDSVTLDADPLGPLRKWRAAREDARVRLLHGDVEVDRVRHADRFAADSERAGWLVYRGRQDVELPPWLSSGPLRAGKAGVLLVIDRADTWHPKHLPELLLATIANTRAAVRVLLLADQAGPWWQALVRVLGKQGLDTGAQQLYRPPRRARPVRELYDQTVETVLRALDLHDPRQHGLPRWADLDVPGNSSDFAAQALGVAVTLDALTRGPITRRAARAAISLLRHEHRYRMAHREAGPADPQAVGRLVFLAALMRPLRHQVARDLALHFGLIDHKDGWLRLLNGYEAFYPDDQYSLSALGATELADELLAAVLVERDTELGVDPGWAVGIVEGMADLPVEEAVNNALSVLAHAGKRYPRLATQYLHPLVRHWPDLAIRAGGAAILAMLDQADITLLARINEVMPSAEGRPIGLDPAAASIEQRLVNNELGRLEPSGSHPAREAPLHLRLARSLYRAGLLEVALSSAELAVQRYKQIVTSQPRSYTADLCAALICYSELHGRLGNFTAALRAAEDAEYRLRKRRLEPGRSGPGANLGSALASLGRQKAQSGQARGALRDAREAVIVLRGLADLQPVEYEPELVEALVSLAHREAEAQDRDTALRTAGQAVELGWRLVDRNRFAHEHRLAAALACRSARLTGQAAIAETEQAVQLYRRCLQASPDRFRPALAATLVLQAGQLLSEGKMMDALAAAEEAAALHRAKAKANPRAYAADLGWALFRAGQALIALDRPAEALTSLDEAITLWQRVVRHAPTLNDPLATAKDLYEVTARGLT